MNLHFFNLCSSDTIASICPGEYDNISTCNEFFHKSANPPALRILGTTSPCCLSIFRFTPSISITSNLVSIRKTKVGSFSNATFWSALTVMGFPSPLQFQLMTLIVPSGAVQQPPPIPTVVRRAYRVPLSHHPL